MNPASATSGDKPIERTIRYDENDLFLYLKNQLDFSVRRTRLASSEVKEKIATFFENNDLHFSLINIEHAKAFFDESIKQLSRNANKELAKSNRDLICAELKEYITSPTSSSKASEKVFSENKIPSSPAIPDISTITLAKRLTRKPNIDVWLERHNITERRTDPDGNCFYKAVCGTGKTSYFRQEDLRHHLHIKGSIILDGSNEQDPFFKFCPRTDLQTAIRRKTIMISASHPNDTEHWGEGSILCPLVAKTTEKPLVCVQDKGGREPEVIFYSQFGLTRQSDPDEEIESNTIILIFRGGNHWNYGVKR